MKHCLIPAQGGKRTQHPIDSISSPSHPRPATGFVAGRIVVSTPGLPLLPFAGRLGGSQGDGPPVAGTPLAYPPVLFAGSIVVSTPGLPMVSFAGRLGGAQGDGPPVVLGQASPHHRPQQEGSGARGRGPLCAAVPAQVPRSECLLHDPHWGQRRLVRRLECLH